MDDDLTTLEQVLRDRAAEVPHLQEAPPRMLVRARRRVVRNAVTSAVAAALIIVGASAGLAGLRASSSDLGGGPTPTPSTSACSAGDLEATANLDGAAGSLVGSIDLKNHGDFHCTLEGRPTISVSDGFGRPMAPLVIDADPQWKVDGASPPSGWPIVNLRSFEVGAISVRWTNPCPQLTHGAFWTVDLGNGTGTVQVFVPDPPSCNGATEPSRLEVGPFEPGGER
jgi:hypothetical protein